MKGGGELHLFSIKASLNLLAVLFPFSREVQELLVRNRHEQSFGKVIDTHCIDYDDYLADDDNDDKEDDKATEMLGANDDDGRYHEDKSMTFSKQVKHTLNYKLEILVSQEPRGASRQPLSQSPLGGRVGEEPVNEFGVGVGRP